jgi:hypothetical protein
VCAVSNSSCRRCCRVLRIVLVHELRERRGRVSTGARSSRMLMLLCATTAVARMRLGVSVGGSASSCRLGIRHRIIRCSSDTASAQGGDATASTQGDNDERLMSWFAQNGGSGTVAVAAQAGLRGLVATRDVQVGDVLLDVPLTATLLDFSEQGSPLPGAAPAWSASLPSKVRRALLVLL